MAEHLTFEDSNGGSTQEHTAVAVDHALQHVKTSNKRKRDASDQGGDAKHSASKRTTSSVNGNGQGIYQDSGPSSTQDFSVLPQQMARHAANTTNHGGPENPSSTAAAALAGIVPQLTVPQPTELSFMSNASTDQDRHLDPSFDLGVDHAQNHNVQGNSYGLGGFQATAAQVQRARESSNGVPKHPVGSEEWHKVRRDNHKEGEKVDSGRSHDVNTC